MIEKMEVVDSGILKFLILYLEKLEKLSSVERKNMMEVVDVLSKPMFRATFGKKLCADLSKMLKVKVVSK